MEKPKLERIALILELFSDEELGELNFEFTDDIDFDKGEWNSLIIGLQETWNEISEGKIPYPENPLIKDLLKEYNLEEYLQDLRFLGFLFSGWIKDDIEFMEYAKQRNKTDSERMQALNCLFQEKGNTEIVFKGLNKKKSIKIKDPIIINEIQKALIEKIKKSDYRLGNCSDADLKNYVSSIRKPSRGRPKDKEKLKEVINNLYEYLQYFTKLQVYDGAKYSNKQARFIFSFLQIFSLMKDADIKVRKEDIIGYYLKGNRLKSTKQY